MDVRVNGAVIAEDLITAEMDGMRDAYAEYARSNGGEPGEAELREWAEENLIERELFRQEALATQKEPSDERARRELEEHADFYRALPEAERLARAKEELRIRALEKELRKKIPAISDEAVRRDYEEKKARLLADEPLRLWHVCRRIGVHGCGSAEAFLDLLDLRTKVVGGRLHWYEALEFSDTYGRDYGIFPPVVRGNLPEEVERKLFALEPGEVSDVIELYGKSAHLFRLLAKEPPRTLSFEEAKEGLRQALFGRAYEESLERKYDALKARAVIQRSAPSQTQA